MDAHKKQLWYYLPRMKRAEKSGKLAAAVEMGRRGGKKKVPKGFSKLGKRRRKAVAKKGVASRMKNMTSEQRSLIAKKAAQTRWGKSTSSKPRTDNT